MICGENTKLRMSTTCKNLFFKSLSKPLKEKVLLLVSMNQRDVSRFLVTLEIILSEGILFFSNKFQSSSIDTMTFASSFWAIIKRMS